MRAARGFGRLVGVFFVVSLVLDLATATTTPAVGLIGYVAAAVAVAWIGRTLNGRLDRQFGRRTGFDSILEHGVPDLDRERVEREPLAKAIGLQAEDLPAYGHSVYAVRMEYCAIVFALLAGYRLYQMIGP